MKRCQTIFIIFHMLMSCDNHQKTPSNDTSPPSKERIQVAIETFYGTMVVELFNETPQHRDNFVKLVRSGFYDGLLLHRVQAGFMLQGGDPDSRGIISPETRLGFGNAKQRIKAEIDPQFIMRQGALCGFHKGLGMQADKSSNGSQFMLIHGQALKAHQLDQQSLTNKIEYSPKQIELYELYGGSPQLDGKYTIFGQVVEGMHILNKIVRVPTHRSVNPRLPDRPLKDVRIQMSVTKESNTASD